MTYTGLKAKSVLVFGGLIVDRDFDERFAELGSLLECKGDDESNSNSW